MFSVDTLLAFMILNPSRLNYYFLRNYRRLKNDCEDTLRRGKEKSH
jgi:hypothetical protein